MRKDLRETNRKDKVYRSELEPATKSRRTNFKLNYCFI